MNNVFDVNAREKGVKKNSLFSFVLFKKFVHLTLVCKTNT